MSPQFQIADQISHLGEEKRDEKSSEFRMEKERARDSYIKKIISIFSELKTILKENKRICVSKCMIARVIQEKLEV